MVPHFFKTCQIVLLRCFRGNMSERGVFEEFFFFAQTCCEQAHWTQEKILSRKCTWPKISRPLNEELELKQVWTPSFGSRSADLTPISIISKPGSAKQTPQNDRQTLKSIGLPVGQAGIDPCRISCFSIFKGRMGLS